MRTPAEICPKCGTRTFLDEPSDVGLDPLLGRVFDSRYRIESLPLFHSNRPTRA